MGELWMVMCNCGTEIHTPEQMEHHYTAGHLSQCEYVGKYYQMTGKRVVMGTLKSSDIYTNNFAAPQFVVSDKGGRLILRLDTQTGRVELGEGATLDEASQEFWDAVGKLGGPNQRKDYNEGMRKLWEYLSDPEDTPPEDLTLVKLVDDLIELKSKPVYLDLDNKQRS